MIKSKKQFSQPGSLHKETLSLLRNDPRSLAIISSESGISFYWLQRFNSGRFQNPSVNRVQHLYEFLTGQKLGV